MKKLIIFALMLGFALPVSAQTNPSRERMQPRQAMQAARDEFRTSVEAKRAEAQKSAETRREALRSKLAGIRDERKKAAVERIDKNLTDLNARMTTHYAAVLDQVDKVLDRVIVRTDRVQASGKDTAAVRSAIVEAETAIRDARAAVAAQAGKSYALNVGTEANLKKDVGAARQGLHADLKAVQEKVQAARISVRKVAVTLAQIPGVDGTATSTPTSTNQ